MSWTRTRAVIVAPLRVRLTSILRKAPATNGSRPSRLLTAKRKLASSGHPESSVADAIFELRHHRLSGARRVLYE